MFSRNQSGLSGHIAREPAATIEDTEHMNINST